MSRLGFLSFATTTTKMNAVSLILCVLILIQNLEVISGTGEQNAFFAAPLDVADSHNPNQLTGDSNFLKAYGGCSLQCLQAEEEDCFQRCMRNPEKQQQQTSADPTSTEGIRNPEKQRQSSEPTSTDSNGASRGPTRCCSASRR